MLIFLHDCAQSARRFQCEQTLNILSVAAVRSEDFRSQDGGMSSCCRFLPKLLQEAARQAGMEADCWECKTGGGRRERETALPDSVIMEALSFDIEVSEPRASPKGE